MNNMNFVNDYFFELGLQFERAYSNSFSEDSFDNEYFNEHAPSIMIEDSTGEVILNEMLESAWYNKAKNTAVFVTYSDKKDIVIPNFSSADIEQIGSNMVLKNVQTDLYHEDTGLYKVTLYRM